MRILSRNLCVFATFLALPSTVFTGPCDELKVLIDKTYNFKPSRLTRAEQDVKSDAMDKVWSLVDDNPKLFLPCLRSEIAARPNDSFFRFNASNLVFKHDKSDDAKRLMITAYSGADLADINLRYWLPYMSALGFEGFDVTAAGETWIRFPKAGYYLPQHGSRQIDRGIGSLAIFGSMEEAKATPVLARLAAEEDEEIRGIATWLLLNLATTEADAEVRKLAGKLPVPTSERLLNDLNNPKLIVPREGVSKASRAQFLKAFEDLFADKKASWLTLVAEVPDGEKDMVKELTLDDLPMVRRARRYYAANATPHSPDWYLTFTQVINTLRLKKAEPVRK